MSESSLSARIGNSKVLLKECPYPDENALKKVFSDNIHLIRDLIGKEFQVCGREISFSLEDAGLSADIVLIDEDGVPTIIETKLLKNREIRREVLGQILEYITAIYLDPDQLIEKCSEYQGDWSKVKDNIKNRKIRGIIVSDKIPPTVKYTIEIINEEMDKIELLGLELHKYCSEEDNIEVIVPQLIGITSKVVSRGKTREGKIWTYEELRNYFETISDPKLKERLIRILEWAKNNGVLSIRQASVKTPQIRIASLVTREVVFRIEGDTGRVEVYIGKEKAKAFTNQSKRYELYNELVQRGLLSQNIESPDRIQYSKYLTKKLGELTDEEFDTLLKIIAKYVLG